MRIGHGFDVHAFSSDPNRKLILGGVEVEGPGLEGHSDADVVTHALMDALLGAARLGDIGEHFPDTDSAYKGADSIVLLTHVKKLLDKHNITFIDADITIAAQTPKLAAYKVDMRRCLADALGTTTDHIGISATTTEKLGFVGRKEGIAVAAVCICEER